MCADRARYELQQAALLRALQGRDAILNGFETEDLAAASESLLRKRARAVADSWPALTHALGGEFLIEFERFARATRPPREGEGIADGFRFANSLDPTSSPRTPGWRSCSPAACSNSAQTDASLDTACS